jgi:hypothetical protein
MLSPSQGEMQLVNAAANIIPEFDARDARQKRDARRNQMNATNNLLQHRGGFLF